MILLFGYALSAIISGCSSFPPKAPSLQCFQMNQHIHRKVDVHWIQVKIPCRIDSLNDFSKICCTVSPTFSKHPPVKAETQSHTLVEYLHEKIRCSAVSSWPWGHITHVLSQCNPRLFRTSLVSILSFSNRQIYELYIAGALHFWNL